MSRVLLLLALSGVRAHAQHYEVYITDCAGHACTDQRSLAASWGIPNKQVGSSDPPALPLFLSKLTYASDHKLLRRDPLSSVQQGMGYIDVDTKRGRALFVTQGTSPSPSGGEAVDIYVIDINGSTGALPKPQLLIGDRSALLAPCKNRSRAGAAGGCTWITASHARWFGEDVVFSFMAWTELGDLDMAQGLAIVRGDGTGARILTHDASVCPYAVCDGTKPPERGERDNCAKPLSGNRAVFLRGNRLAVLELQTGNVTVLDQVPLVADESGCPSVDPRGEEVLYMACTPYEQCIVQDGNVTFTYGRVAVSDPSHFVPDFEVKLVDSPNFYDTYGTASCAYDHGSGGSISCLGADTNTDEALKLAVDPKTGSAAKTDDKAIPMCMTPECVQVHLVEGPARYESDVAMIV